MRLALACVVVVVVVVATAVPCALASPTHNGAVLQAESLKSGATIRSAHEATRAITEFLLHPAYIGRGLQFLNDTGLLKTPKAGPPVPDLELFDLSMPEHDVISQLFKLIKTTRGRQLGNVELPEHFVTLPMFRKLRPLLGIMPPLRIMTDIRQQFQYYAGPGAEVLNAVSMTNALANLGAEVGQSTASNLLRRMQIRATEDLGVSRCEFTLAVLRERDFITAQMIKDANVVFKRLKADAIAASAFDEKHGRIPLRLWFQTPGAVDIFRFKEEVNPETTLELLERALAILYDIPGKTAKGVPMMSKCDHQILHAFTATQDELEEAIEEDWDELRYETNRVAAWIIEDFGERETLGVTCRRGPDNGKCTNVFKESTAKQTDCQEVLTETGALCDLSRQLGASTAKATLTSFDGVSTKFSPLYEGLDALFILNDRSGDLVLSHEELRSMLHAVALFGEMAHRSAPTPTTKEDERKFFTRNHNGLPFFHAWYLSKRTQYHLNLMRQIAKMSENKMESSSFKQFWNAVHYANDHRIWERMRSLEGKPLRLLDTQGMFNKLGYTGNVAQKVVREWHRNTARHCNLEGLTVQERFGIVQMLWDSKAAAEVSYALEDLPKLAEQFCEQVYGHPGLKCVCADNRDKCEPQGQWQGDIRGFVCEEPEEDQRAFDSDRTTLNIMEFLDSNMLGIPVFSQNLPLREFRHFFRLLRGSNDNFDEITPERWQLMAPILESFSDLDTDSSGTIAPREFRAFGRCTSHVQPRLRIASNVDTNLIFNKIQALATALRDTDVVYKETRPSSDGGLTLTEFSLLFSDLNSEGCLKRYCSQAGVRKGMGEACAAQQDASAQRLFCTVNYFNSPETHPGSVTREEVEQLADCKRMFDVVRKREGGTPGSVDFEGELKRHSADALEKAEQSGVFALTCVPMGVVSFDSYLDPSATSELRDSLTFSRVERCVKEARCSNRGFRAKNEGAGDNDDSNEVAAGKAAVRARKEAQFCKDL